MKLFVLLISFFLFFKINSQIEYNHSFGSSISVIISSGYSSLYPGFTYNPRLDYVIEDYFSISVTSYPTVGLNIFDYNHSFHIPLMFQFNLGNHASKEADYLVGLFAGAGYSLGLFRDKPNIGGPFATLGLKFRDRRKTALRFDILKGKDLSYFKTAKIYSIGIMFNF